MKDWRCVPLGDMVRTIKMRNSISGHFVVRGRPDHFRGDAEDHDIILDEVPLVDLRRSYRVLKRHDSGLVVRHQEGSVIFKTCTLTCFFVRA